MTPNQWERVRANLSQADPEGCWEWTGTLSTGGYGLVHIDGRQQAVHRVVYEHLVGPIPEGLHLDHLCRTRRCARPVHLEPVTPTENILRGLGMGARNALKTHCPQGHPYSPENTLHKTARGRVVRRCRVCHREQSNRYQNKRRARIRAHTT